MDFHRSVSADIQLVAHDLRLSGLLFKNRTPFKVARIVRTIWLGLLRMFSVDTPKPPRRMLTTSPRYRTDTSPSFSAFST